jgi:hypothetical protein
MVSARGLEETSVWFPEKLKGHKESASRRKDCSWRLLTAGRALESLTVTERLRSMTTEDEESQLLVMRRNLIMTPNDDEQMGLTNREAEELPWWKGRALDMQRRQNHCIESMHKMHREYKNVEKRRDGLLLLWMMHVWRRRWSAAAEMDRKQKVHWMGMAQKAQEAKEQKSAMDACRKTVRKTEQRNLAKQWWDW